MSERDERDAGATRAGEPRQQALFEIGPGGRLGAPVATMPALEGDSPLPVARYWYRRHLEQGGHSHNTIESYSYDLALFELQVGPRPIAAIKARDVATFLGESNTRSTRKRRLTSLSGFFKYLVGSAKVLRADPSENFYPEHYLPGHMFEGLAEVAPPGAEEARALAWRKFQRWHRCGVRATRLDFDANVFDPWTRGQAARRLAFAALRRGRSLRDLLR